MNAVVLFFLAVFCLSLGYFLYSKWLEKQWGVISGNKTPAHELNDGVDYVPAKMPLVMGHHFSSIAGAGPINGPIFASVFGWIPVVIWIVLGGIFFGAAHDYGALVASLRNRGQSIGIIIQNTMGEVMKKLFLVFGYFALILVIAAFSSIVAKTFAAINPASGQQIVDMTANNANAATAMISLLFIVIALIFGFFFRVRGQSLILLSVLGMIGIVAIIFIGMNWHPIYLSESQWMIVIAIYIGFASILPVWLLLQPRDYLSSFLLYFMMLIGILGIVAAHPTIEMPTFTGWSNEQLGSLFPALFVTIACGAISGFHSLVASGTTAKQLNTEKDARPVAYGSMLIESVLAIISIIAVAYIWNEYVNSGYKIPPTKVFAQGLSSMFGILPGMENAQGTIYSLLILAVSAFCLTSLDTSTRLARYMFQEFWQLQGQEQSKNVIIKILSDKYVATIITIAIGIFLGLNGYKNIWILFGAANQLLAVLGLLAVVVWLGKIGKNNKMLLPPLIFMMCVTILALFLLIAKDINYIVSPNATTITWAVARIIIAAILLVLSVVLLVNGIHTLFTQKKLVNAK